MAELGLASATLTGMEDPIVHQVKDEAEEVLRVLRLELDRQHLRLPDRALRRLYRDWSFEIEKLSQILSGLPSPRSSRSSMTGSHPIVTDIYQYLTEWYSILLRCRQLLTKASTQRVSWFKSAMGVEDELSSLLRKMQRINQTINEAILLYITAASYSPISTIHTELSSNSADLMKMTDSLVFPAKAQAIYGLHSIGQRERAVRPKVE